MKIIPESTLLGVLSSCLELSRLALDEIQEYGSTAGASDELAKGYSQLIATLHDEKRNDSTLADQTWEWIWEVKPDLSAIQIYGRLAWINYTLLDLL